MELIHKGLPKEGIVSFPFEAHSFSYSFTPKTSLDSLPTDKAELLSMLVKDLLKQYDWDIDEADAKRALKALPRIATSVKLEKVTGMMSLFVHTYSERMKDISTSIIDNTELPECMDAPANIDYNQEYLENTGDDLCDLLSEEGIRKDCVFSVEHKNRSEEPTVPCAHCHGSGIIKCPNCNGSGRESYEDGNYANGEVRIKTGMCSECGGSGRINCPECFGKGVIDIFSPYYSVVRSVKEVISKCATGVAVFGGETFQFLSTDRSIMGRLSIGSPRYINAVEVANRDGMISFRKKNGKEYLEDHRQEILAAMEQNGLKEQYDRVLKESEPWKGKKDKTPIARQEAHYLFPAIVLQADYGDNDHATFVVYERDGKTYAKLKGLSYMERAEVIKYKILSLFKK